MALCPARFVEGECVLQRIDCDMHVHVYIHVDAHIDIVDIDSVSTVYM